MASNLSASQTETQDSDEIKEMYCEECDKHSAKYVPAEGFCVDCVEYKCDLCILYHKRHYCNHQVQDKNNMPQDFCFEKCSAHSNEIVKFYCEKCDKTACCMCKTNNHQSCNKVRHLPKVVKGVEQSKEFQDVLKQMDTLSEDLEYTRQQLQSNIEYIASQETKEKLKISNKKDKLVNSYSKQQKEILEDFDKKMEETISKLKKERQTLVEQLAERKRNFKEKLNYAEKDVIKKIINSKQTDQANLDALMKKTLTLIDDLKILSADLKQKQNLGQRCQLFIAMKTAKESLRNLEKEENVLQGKNEIHYYNTELTKSDVTMETLDNSTNFFSYEDIPKSRIGRAATLHSDIETGYSGDQSSCLLSVNTLIVAYCNAKCLAVVQNLKQIKPTVETLDMSFRPWDITKVEDNKVAVTFPNERIVRLITFSETMTVINTDDIEVRAECYGIVCSNDNLIVSYYPGEVQIFDMSGHVIKTFDKDSKGQSLFSDPRYLTVSPDNTTIYVSDFGRDAVTSLTFDGKVKAIYKDDQLRAPCQLTVDESGTEYVCGRSSNNVHQLSSDLTKVKILLDKSHGLYRPASVAYCQNNNRLYVGMYKNKIKVFNLSLQ